MIYPQSFQPIWYLHLRETDSRIVIHIHQYTQEPRNDFYSGGARVNTKNEILTIFQNFT